MLLRPGEATVEAYKLSEEDKLEHYNFDNQEELSGYFIMRALLVQLPHKDRVATLFPIGIANIATALSEVGVESEILDIFALSYSREDVVEFLRKSRWDMIGINAYSTQYPWAKWLADEAKRLHPDVLIIMGGPLATFNSKLVVEKTNTDVCVISEGEETIKDIVSNMGDFSRVRGICFKSATGAIIETTKRPYIKNIDSLPFTNYDYFLLDIYFSNMGIGIPGVKTINMFTSRGCPYKCNFCSRTFEGSRLRSIDNIIEEIGRLKDKYGIRGIAFADELVLVNKKRAYELCEKIKPLKIYWNCQGRVNTVDLQLLKAMKAAGCTNVGYGVESGSQKILNNMNKKVTVKQNELAITNTIKAGMTPIVQMIYGYPGEDQETIRETLEFFDRIHFYPPVGYGKAHVSLLTPLPGSPIYEDLVTDGRIRSEEEYLLGLEQGYYIGCPLRINLTQFNDEELLNRRTELINQLHANYRKCVHKHPIGLFRRYTNALSSIYAVESFWGLIRLFPSLVRKLFQKWLFLLRR